MKFRLYHYWRSSCSWRVRWAMFIKGLPCEFIMINLLSDESDSPEYLKKNPMGYVPTLELIDSNGNSRFLTESISIIEFLEEVHPKPALLPKDPFERAQVRQLVETINSGTQPLQNLNVMQHYSHDPEQQKQWNRTWIQKGLQAYETFALRTAGTYSFGDTLTVADLVLIPQCYNALRYEMTLKEFPTLDRLYQHAIKTEGYQASFPEKFKP